MNVKRAIAIKFLDSVILVVEILNFSTSDLIKKAKD